MRCEIDRSGGGAGATGGDGRGNIVGAAPVDEGCGEEVQELIAEEEDAVAVGEEVEAY